MRYKPIGTGTYNIPGTLPSTGHPNPGKSSVSKDRGGDAPSKSATSSTTKSLSPKALPTVFNRTANQFDAGRKEHIHMEVDPSGETKVWKDGYPLEGRIFRCRTFQLPGRGETLFMLGADCAHALGYQNPFSLFNQNTSLDEIVVTRTEKESLVEQEIVPGWYTYDMSIRVSVVTARSMFRQFGAKLVENGRRVQDDYWEAKAREQGFTAEHVASETTPGAAKARESRVGLTLQARTFA
jgi:hypothetical protein